MAERHKIVNRKNSKRNMEQYLITLEEHITDERIVRENANYNKPQKLTKEEQEVQDFFRSHTLVGDDLTDIERKRLPIMDSQNVSIQILSYTSPVSDQVPREEAVRICREANNILAEKIEQHPTRFRGMATLPMADPEAAAEELERSVKELGFVGTLLAGQYQEHWYDEAQFEPIFRKAAELDVPIYLHPALINPVIRQKAYMSPSYSPIVGAELASAGFGWHLDVGILAVRLILAGIFDKYPSLKIVAGHWGEGIPMMLDRMDYMLTQEKTGLKHEVSWYYKNNIYMTPSGIESKINLHTMIKIMGAHHILYAQDYPYIQSKSLYGFLMDDDLLTDKQKALIAHENAERLYHL